MVFPKQNSFAHYADPEEVIADFRRAAESMGATRLSVTVPVPFHASANAGTYFYNWNFLGSLADRYRDALRRGTALIPDLIIDGGKPVLWRDIADGAAFNLSPERRKIFRDFVGHHTEDGVSIPLYGPFGHRALLSITFAPPVTDPSDQRIDAITSLGTAAYARYVELVRRSQSRKVNLSAREQEVLAHVSAGRTTKEMARLMELSPSSVDTYLRRIFEKLEVDDRTAAAVKALSLGLFKL